MSIAVALFSVVIFAITFRWLGITAICGQALSSARSSMASLTDPALSDMQKERAARQGAGVMLRYGTVITVRLILAVAPPTALAFAASAVGLLSENSLISAFLSWPVIGLGIALLAYELIRSR